jgi:hypothetical protein
LDIWPHFAASGHEPIGAVHPGLVAFFPVPARAVIKCSLDDDGDPKSPNKEILLSPPQTVYLYTESHFLDPQRDFLTSPQDSLSFTSGFIVGHKYTDQSAAKTVVDTVTQPIRSLMPSVSVSQSVSVSPTGARSTSMSTNCTTKGAVSHSSARRASLYTARGRHRCRALRNDRSLRYHSKPLDDA